MELILNSNVIDYNDIPCGSLAELGDDCSCDAGSYQGYIFHAIKCHNDEYGDMYMDIEDGELYTDVEKYNIIRVLDVILKEK